MHNFKLIFWETTCKTFFLIGKLMEDVLPVTAEKIRAQDYRDTLFCKTPSHVATLLLLVSGFPEMTSSTFTFPWEVITLCDRPRPFGCTSNVPFPPNRALMAEKRLRSGISTMWKFSRYIGRAFHLLPSARRNIICKSAIFSGSILSNFASLPLQTEHKTDVISLYKDRLLPCCHCHCHSDSSKPTDASCRQPHAHLRWTLCTFSLTY